MNAFLPILLAFAVFFDLRERRIPNALVLVGGASGLYLGFAAQGAAGIGNNALGMVAGGAILFPFFALRWVGAGDVKLLAVVGAHVGFPDILMAFVWTSIAGGLLGLAALVARGGYDRFFAHLRLLLFALPLGRKSGFDLTAIGTESAVRIPYALAIAAGTLLTGIL